MIRDDNHKLSTFMTVTSYLFMFSDNYSLNMRSVPLNRLWKRLIEVVVFISRKGLTTV